MTLHGSCTQLLPGDLRRSLAQRYDAQASVWDQKLQQLGFNRLYAQLFQDIQTHGLLGNLENESQVLDIGIGTGALTAALLKQVSVTPRVTGVDISDAMLQRAAGRLSNMDVSYDLLRADIRTMAHTPKRYDLVICAHVLEHLEDPAACVAHIRQMLKPGGRFLLVITRCGPWGYFLRQRWGVNPVAVCDVKAWFEHADMWDVTVLPLRGTLLGRLSSVAVTGIAE